MAKPVYGGWVTFTAHMSKKNDYPIYKITKKSEKTQRDYGYDCKYQNLNLVDSLKLQNCFITAVEKHYWEFLRYFPNYTGAFNAISKIFDWYVNYLYNSYVNIY